MTMTGRLGCSVPGCGRTFKRRYPDDPDEEVICGKHWRMADPWARHVITRLRRRGARLGWGFREEALFFKLWSRCKRQAIERAFGL